MLPKHHDNQRWERGARESAAGDVCKRVYVCVCTLTCTCIIAGLCVCAPVFLCLCVCRWVIRPSLVLPSLTMMKQRELNIRPGNLLKEVCVSMLMYVTCTNHCLCVCVSVCLQVEGQAKPGGPSITMIKYTNLRPEIRQLEDDERSAASVVPTNNTLVPTVSSAEPCDRLGVQRLEHLTPEPWMESNSRPAVLQVCMSQ